MVTICGSEPDDSVVAFLASAATHRIESIDDVCLHAFRRSDQDLVGSNMDRIRSRNEISISILNYIVTTFWL